MRTAIGILALTLALATGTLAQSPEFDVASVKINKTIATRRGLGFPGDRLEVTALTLHQNGREMKARRIE